jgi:hypothetical protein
MKKLLETLKTDLPSLQFVAGEAFYWSPKDNTINYKLDLENETSVWALLHEVAHCLLQHTTYNSDFELMQLEVAAWHKAEKLAKHYGVTIDPEHIQDCLDTYRDWLHRRSTCPTCGVVSLQKDSQTYQCFNCQTQWHVSNSRFCRPYRRLAKTS